jgi:hypothetical protein
MVKTSSKLFPTNVHRTACEFTSSSQEISVRFVFSHGRGLFGYAAIGQNRPAAFICDWLMVNTSLIQPLGFSNFPETKEPAIVFVFFNASVQAGHFHQPQVKSTSLLSCTFSHENANVFEVKLQIIVHCVLIKFILFH